MVRWYVPHARGGCTGTRGGVAHRRSGSDELHLIRYVRETEGKNCCWLLVTRHDIRVARTRSVARAVSWGLGHSYMGKVLTN